MTAGLQVTKAIASFPTIFIPALLQCHTGKTWECLLKSLSPAPPFHSHAFLLSSTYTGTIGFFASYHTAGSVHFWTHPFLGSMIPAKATFSVSAAEVCLSHHLSSVLNRTEEERAFLFAIRSSCPIIHASIHLFTQGQHPSWVFSASHISLCLLFHSKHRVLCLLCNKPSFLVHFSELRCKSPIARGPWG